MIKNIKILGTGGERIPSELVLGTNGDEMFMLTPNNEGEVVIVVKESS